MRDILLAAASTLLGSAMIMYAYIQSRKSATEKARKECHEELLKEQRISEKLSKELHDLRMKYGEADDE